MAYFYVYRLYQGKIPETHHKWSPDHGRETGSQRLQTAVIAMPTHWVCWQTCFWPKDSVIVASGLFFPTPQDTQHHITTKNFALPRSGESVRFAATFSVYRNRGIACGRVLAYRGFKEVIDDSILKSSNQFRWDAKIRYMLSGSMKASLKWW